jgi:hypothetical protein
VGRLHRLVRWSWHEEAESEIERGADVNAVVGNLTPLEVAIGNGDIAMVDILIRAGADVDHCHPKTGKHPLEGAVMQSDLRILELLLNAGADVEGCRESSTPLCLAAAFGMREAYARLIAAGANPLVMMHGKPANEAIESIADAHEWMRRSLDTVIEEPDKYADQIKKMMAEHPTPEEYAAHRGRDIYAYGIDRGAFTDPEVGAWARALGDIVRSPERLALCEDLFLSGGELDEVRHARKRAQWRTAREQARKERIAVAAQGF